MQEGETVIFYGMNSKNENIRQTGASLKYYLKYTFKEFHNYFK